MPSRGIPAERPPCSCTFLSAHRGVLAAADFFTVDLWTTGGLTRFAVLFVIDLATRRVEIAGMLPEPDSAWMIQCGRQLSDPVDGCLSNRLLFPATRTAHSDSPVACRPRLGGLLKYYHRPAA